MCTRILKLPQFIFSERRYLKQLSKKVDRSILGHFVLEERDVMYSPNAACLSDWLEPLETLAFPEGDLSRFYPVLDYVYYGPDLDVDVHTWMYLASMFLYSDRHCPHGLKLDSAYVRITIEKILVSSDDTLATSFLSLLCWLIDEVSIRKGRDDYFVVLGILFLQKAVGCTDWDEQSLIKYLEQRQREVGGRDLLTDSASCPEVWRKLLANLAVVTKYDLSYLEKVLPISDGDGCRLPE